VIAVSLLFVSGSFFLSGHDLSPRCFYQPDG